MQTRNKRADQYLWEYGTGKFATGPLVIFVPHLDGAFGYFEGWLYGAMAYSGVRFQRGQRLCWSTPVRGHELYLVFTGLFHSENTGPWQISNTGLKIISVGDFNGAMDNFLSSGYGAIRFLGCLNQRGHSKSRHRSPLISRSRIPINIDSSLRVYLGGYQKEIRSQKIITGFKVEDLNIDHRPLSISLTKNTTQQK